MPAIYSGLHRNIQDSFNRAGVEIMSPSYLALRDGNKTTIPAENLPPGYQQPAFLHRFSPVETASPSFNGPAPQTLPTEDHSQQTT
jgi:hypothetical protein